jgi:hypothetical protein
VTLLQLLHMQTIRDTRHTILGQNFFTVIGKQQPFSVSFDTLSCHQLKFPLFDLTNNLCTFLGHNINCECHSGKSLSHGKNTSFHCNQSTTTYLPHNYQQMLPNHLKKSQAFAT